jgi:hypothetical protein
MLKEREGGKGALAVNQCKEMEGLQSSFRQGYRKVFNMPRLVQNPRIRYTRTWIAED